MLLERLYLARPANKNRAVVGAELPGGVSDSSYPINRQMVVGCTELEMQQERDLSPRFFPPFVFLLRKVSTDP